MPANPRPRYRESATRLQSLLGRGSRVPVMLHPDSSSPLKVRHALRQVQETLADTPITVVQGARQVGKSTLVRQVLGDGCGPNTQRLPRVLVYIVSRNATVSSWIP